MKGHETDEFLIGISQATNALISQKLDEGIDLAIAVLGKHLNVFATCVYVNETDEKGAFLASMRHSWTMHSQPTPARIDHNQNIRLKEMPEAYEQMSRGNYYEAFYSSSNGLLKDHMTVDGSKSIVLFPIMVGEEYWGSVALVEFRYERQWGENEKLMLQSLANSFGSAIQKHRLQENLESEVEKRTRELERSRLRFQLAVEGSQDGIWEWLPQEGQNYWSPRMYEQLGYEPDDLPHIGTEFFDMIHPDESDVVRQLFNDHLEKRTPYNVEFRLKTKSGAYRWFRSTGQAQWNDSGQAIRMVGSHEDIHEKKIQEDMLRRSEQRFKAVIEHDPNATFLVNAEGYIELFSQRACQVFGYEACDLQNLSIHDLLPQEAHGRHREHFAKYMQAPDARIMGQGMNLTAKRKNGEEFWVEVGLSPLNIRGEKYVMAVLTDITLRKEAENALKESHRRINDLINNLPGMVYRCKNSNNWPMEFISAASLDITGYPSELFIGDTPAITFGDLIHPDDQEDLWEQVQLALKERKLYRVVYRIKDKRKREKWLWEQGNGVFEGDEVVALEGCIFDITPIVRTQERTNSAIYLAEDKERRRIAGEIHDGLQQTLSVSALNLQYLESELDLLSDECRQRYTKSREFLEKGIRDSRSIAHRLMPKAIHDVGLDRSLQEMLRDVQTSGNVECTYFCNFKERLDTKMAVGLYRTAQEAMNNMLKYANATKVTVQLMKYDREIQLLIEDNGVGFDKNELDLYKEGYGLTGMKNRINSLSGSMHIDTKPGHGTTILIRIPT